MTMKNQPKNADQATSKRAPYRRPKLRVYGSIQSMTLSTDAMSLTMDGVGGGGKTNI